MSFNVAQTSCVELASEQQPTYERCIGGRMKKYGIRHTFTLALVCLCAGATFAQESDPAAPKTVNAAAPASNDAPALRTAGATIQTAAAAAVPQNAPNQATESSTQEPVAPQGPPVQPSESDVPDEQEPLKAGLDIYGFAQLDMGYDFGQNDPDWFDVVRPTKLPSFQNEFSGRDGIFYASVRQTRFGVKSYLPTALGELKTIFEFELFGVGVDAGQTTFRLRHAWGELGQFGAGQTWSPFMDPDVFPNSIEYWGPSGMVFFRNIQLRWQPINNGNKQLWFALERPGASADLGPFASRIELLGVRGRFPAPDLSARLRWGGERSHFQVSGIGRYIAWDDPSRNATLDISGHTWGWGVNLSGVVGVAKKDAARMSVTYGHGIENYMNDAPVDIATKLTTNPRTPITGEPLPVFGMSAFYDLFWNDRWSTTFGYSLLNIDNAATQAPVEFHRGQYGIANLMYYPVKNLMTGPEFEWGRRDNFRDGYTFDDYRIQYSARFSFDYKLGHAK